MADSEISTVEGEDSEERARIHGSSAGRCNRPQPGSSKDQMEPVERISKDPRKPSHERTRGFERRAAAVLLPRGNGDVHGGDDLADGRLH